MDDLVMVEEFLNTLDERTFSVHGEAHVPSDALESPVGLSAWSLRPSDRAAAVALRSALRASLIVDDEKPAPDLSSFPLRLAPAPGGGLSLVATTGAPSLDAIVQTVATSVAAGAWKRLKLCVSADCHWAFYDTSRSGGGRWCSMEVCGNRHKTRAYRARNA